jgi:hypothetical protein
VAEVVRRLTSGDKLLAVVQLLGGGVVGYFLGLKQGREQARYDRRAVAVTELRRRLRETREAFANLATPSEYRRLANEARPRDELAEEAGEKLDELDDYYRDHSLWLDRRTYEKLDHFTDELAFGLAEAVQRLRDEGDEDAAVRPLWDWIGQEAAEEEEELDEEFERSLGKRPWWRRVFGG